MLSSTLAVAFLSFLGAASATNYFNTGVHCGTTSNAKLSDCQALINNQATWDAAWATGNSCTYWNLGSIGIAYNMACHGNCCVYAAGRASGVDYDKYTTQSEAAGLLGCGDASSDQINALQTFTDHGICISDGNGCGDCFDDSDFTKRHLLVSDDRKAAARRSLEEHEEASAAKERRAVRFARE
ncbi:hypothetical protein MNV49_003359 [Pseudohyphozyma bogoriensis]|nr:hypothetical protein MNV49_003359 [Pseudohyphozyma bogoriensis]